MGFGKEKVRDDQLEGEEHQQVEDWGLAACRDRENLLLASLL